MRALPNTAAANKIASSDPAADTNAAVTIVAIADERHVIDWIACSYNKIPTGIERITVTVAAVLKFSVYLPVLTDGAGPWFFPFPQPIVGGLNQEVIVQLTAASGTTLGSVTVGYR